MRVPVFAMAEDLMMAILAYSRTRTLGIGVQTCVWLSHKAESLDLLSRVAALSLIMILLCLGGGQGGEGKGGRGCCLVRPNDMPELQSRFGSNSDSSVLFISLQ